MLKLNPCFCVPLLSMVHTVCACSVPLRILGDRILSYTCPLTNPQTCPCSTVCCWTLAIVIVLFSYKQISFVKYRRLCALQAIAKDTDTVAEKGTELDFRCGTRFVDLGLNSPISDCEEADLCCLFWYRNKGGGNTT